MMLHHARLRAKGWTEDELRKADAGLRKAQERKHPWYARLERWVYYGLLFLTLVGIFAVSIAIVPVLLMLTTTSAVLVLVLLGLCLGALFAHLIQDIDGLEWQHHTLATLLLTTMGIVNIWFIVNTVNKLQRNLEIGTQHSPGLLGILFAASLMTPYAIHLIARAPWWRSRTHA